MGRGRGWFIHEGYEEAPMDGNGSGWLRFVPILPSLEVMSPSACRRYQSVNSLRYDCLRL